MHVKALFRQGSKKFSLPLRFGAKNFKPYFCALKSIRGYFSAILLVVFCWAALPAHTIHELFANHQDTSHEGCDHKHTVDFTQIEKKHKHCEILKTNTPVYERPSLVCFKNFDRIILSEIATASTGDYCSFRLGTISGRGPPSSASLHFY
jgi:hypothetical protein